ncbi:SPOSA6832_03027, partial [Sporobolomyces salmonicolor]
MAASSLAQLLNGQLASLSSPLSDGDFRALALIVGSSMLLEALDLIDKDEVARISPPNGRPLYRVAGSSQSYTVHPELVGGYCPCPAFLYGVVATEHQAIPNTTQCKHLLACQIADRLDAWKDQDVGLKWIAGLATKFGAAPPPPPAQAG